MPIKFRCNQCRQFLGISRSKAGSIVDCPTCGRAVRVPELDGTVIAIPKPVLNLADSELAAALDELASIGEIPEGEEEIEFDEPAAARETRDAPIIKPVLVPEPIQLDAAPTAEPVAPPIQPNAVVHTAVEKTTGYRDDEESDRPLATLAEEGLKLARGPEPKSSTITPTFHRTAVVTIVVVGIVAFGFGFLTSHLFQSSENPADNQTDPATQANGNADPTTTKNLKASLRGRITYKTESGESRPDRGARVIAFPESRPGSAKLSIVGFRAADSADDAKLAQATMRALGGDMAVVQPDGNYEVVLPTAGKYHVLVLSHYQSNGGNVASNFVLDELLATYFSAPNELLGRLQYRFVEVPYKGDGTEPWDYSFERP